jgi:hypothetical protein
VPTIGIVKPGPSPAAACQGQFVDDDRHSPVQQLRKLDGGLTTLDGHDLRQYAGADVRRVVGLAAQDAHLFNTTIRENLRLARPPATAAAPEAAAGCPDRCGATCTGWRRCGGRCPRCRSTPCLLRSDLRWADAGRVLIQHRGPAHRIEAVDYNLDVYLHEAVCPGQGTLVVDDGAISIASSPSA